MATVTAASLWNLRGVLGQWSTAVPTKVDNRFQSWVIHWVQGALMGENSLYDASTFAPASGSLTFSDHLIGLAGVLLPLRWLGLSPAAVFNTGLVLGMVANAVAAYVLGYVLTRRRTAAVVAGAVYALGPVPWLATMHLNLVWRSGLPLVLAGLWVVADRESGSHPWSRLPGNRVLLALVAAVAAWQGLVSFFYGMFVLVVIAAVIALRWRDLRPRAVAVGLAVTMGVGAFIPSYIPYLHTRDQQPGFAWRLDEIAILRAAPHIVEEANVLWGHSLGRPLFGVDGFHAFPGLVVIALLVSSLLLAPGWIRRTGSSRAPLVGLSLLGVGVVGAIGPGWGPTTEWTPYALAFRFVPGFSALRASGRFVLLALLAASVLAAVAVAETAARHEDRSARTPRREPTTGRRTARRSDDRPHRWVVGMAVAALVAGLAAEGLSRPRDVTPAVSRPVDQALAEAGGSGGVVYLPFGFDGLGAIDAQEEFVIRSTAHDRPMANGFAGFYPASARVLAERLDDLTSERGLDCLAAHGFEFVVVSDRVGLGSAWTELLDPATAAPLELVGEYDGELLYRLPNRVVPAGTCTLPGT